MSDRRSFIGGSAAALFGILPNINNVPLINSKSVTSVVNKTDEVRPVAGQAARRQVWPVVERGNRLLGNNSGP